LPITLTLAVESGILSPAMGSGRRGISKEPLHPGSEIEKVGSTPEFVTLIG